MRLNYQKNHPISLGIETFDMVCGDIRTEANSAKMNGINRVAFAEAILKVVYNMVIWVAKTSEWVRTIKVSKGSVIIVPKRSYFEKWKGAKNLPKKA